MQNETTETTTAAQELKDHADGLLDIANLVHRVDVADWSNAQMQDFIRTTGNFLGDMAKGLAKLADQQGTADQVTDGLLDRFIRTMNAAQKTEVALILAALDMGNSTKEILALADDYGADREAMKSALLDVFEVPEGDEENASDWVDSLYTEIDDEAVEFTRKHGL